MTLLRNRTLQALAIVALAQTAVLATMVIDRVRLLKNGREIVLPIRPVDPRDLFKGDYVRLGYDVTSVPMRLLEGPPPQRLEPVYVVLEKKEDRWLPARMSRAMPNETSPDRIVLKGRAAHGWWPANSRDGAEDVRYGIEHYFVPEGEGRRLETLAGEKKLAAVIAVDSGGNAAIKGLIIDGVRQYEEPLF
jgi:uncharacterized membrane-anchored protein